MKNIKLTAFIASSLYHRIAAIAEELGVSKTMVINMAFQWFVFTYTSVGQNNKVFMGSVRHNNFREVNFKKWMTNWVESK